MEEGVGEHLVCDEGQFAACPLDAPVLPIDVAASSAQPPPYTDSPSYLDTVCHDDKTLLRRCHISPSFPCPPLWHLPCLGHQSPLATLTHDPYTYLSLPTHPLSIQWINKINGRRRHPTFSRPPLLPADRSSAYYALGSAHSGVLLDRSLSGSDLLSLGDKVPECLLPSVEGLSPRDNSTPWSAVSDNTNL